MPEVEGAEGRAPTVHYRWSKAFLEAGKNGLTRDTKRDATTEEVRRLKEENEVLKRTLVEAVLDVQRLNKALGISNRFLESISVVNACAADRVIDIPFEDVVAFLAGICLDCPVPGAKALTER
jgi:hypothetical protein